MGITEITWSVLLICMFWYGHAQIAGAAQGGTSGQSGTSTNGIHPGGTSQYPYPSAFQPQLHHPNVIHFIGAGYNLLKGNPDGEFWNKAGDDPGLKMTHKIFYVTQSNTGTPPQVEVEHRDSCFMSHEYNLIYSTKSYQDRLREAITTSGDADAGLSNYAFTLSSGYQAISVQTSRHHYLFQDYTSLCNMGHARLKLNLASHLSVTNEFAAAVCKLPTTYNQDVYIKFIEEWGTHIITEVEIGKKVTYRYEASLAKYMDFVVKNASEEVSFGGPLNGFDTSIVIDIDSFKYRNEYRALVGGYLDTLGAGNYAYNDQIELVLLTLDGSLKSELWSNMNSFIQQGDCTQDSFSHLSTWRANLLKALAAYPSVSGATTPTDSPLAIPITWPEGTYGLQKPNTGCPGHFNWSEGWRTETTESTKPLNMWTRGNHLAGSLQSNSITFDFCMKSLNKVSPYGMNWPKGDYCVYKYGDCPAVRCQDFKRQCGFTQCNYYSNVSFINGLSVIENFRMSQAPFEAQQASFTVKLDDENTDNHNSQGGAVPEGIYNSDTTYAFCCRSDDSYVNPIILPTDKPFYLFKNKHGCQHVHDMVVQEEYVTIDNEDSHGYGQSNTQYGHPHPAVDIVNTPGRHTTTFHFCFYSAASTSGPLIG